MMGICGFCNRGPRELWCDRITGRFRCNTCRGKRKKRRKCPRCGRRRVLNYLWHKNQRQCAICYNGHNKKRCTYCWERRSVAGKTTTGRPVCTGCWNERKHWGVCPQCGDLPKPLPYRNAFQRRICAACKKNPRRGSGCRIHEESPA